MHFYISLLITHSKVQFGDISVKKPYLRPRRDTNMDLEKLVTLSCSVFSESRARIIISDSYPFV